MTDTVTRLRQAARVCDHHHAPEWVTDPDHCGLCVQLTQAANEIEQLRAEVETYQSFIRESGCVQHLIRCTEGDGCQCGLGDLPLWGQQETHVSPDNPTTGGEG